MAKQKLICIRNDNPHLLTFPPIPRPVPQPPVPRKVNIKLFAVADEVVMDGPHGQIIVEGFKFVSTGGMSPHNTISSEETRAQAEAIFAYLYSVAPGGVLDSLLAVLKENCYYIER